MPPKRAAAGDTPARRAGTRSNTATPVPDDLPARAPRRTVRRSTSPSKLPDALPSKQSVAYGAGGRADLGQDSVVGQGASLSDAIGGVQQPQEEEVEDDVASQTGKAAGKGRKRASPAKAKSPPKQKKSRTSLDLIQEATEEDSEGARPNPFTNRPHLAPEAQEGDTSGLLQQDGSYGRPSTVSDRASNVGRRSPVRASRPVTPAAQPLGRGPILRTELWRTKAVQGFLRQPWWLKLLEAVSFLFFCLQAVTFIPPVGHTDLVHDIKRYERTAWNKVASIMPGSDTLRPSWPRSSGVTGDMQRRLAAVEVKVEQLSKKTDTLYGTLDDLKSALPEHIVVGKDKDGDIIPDHFWHALKAKLASQGYASQDWHAWMAANQNAISNWVGQTINNQIQSSRIVTRDEFTDLLRNTYVDAKVDLSPDLDRRLRALEGKQTGPNSKLTDDAIAAVEEKFQGMLKQLPQEQLSSLVANKIARNADQALRSVNFLSPNNGAVVDPYLSSPTKIQLTSKAASAYLWLRGRRENPPIAALQPWSEAGDCWCAASAYVDPALDEVGYARAQLAVHTGYDVIPTSITIEHIPRTGTLATGAAPKDLELWVQIDNESDFRRMQGVSQQYFGTSSLDETIESDKHRYDRGLKGQYVQAAFFKYDWSDSANHVQTFPVQMDLALENMSTRKIVLRSRTNYGGDFTCLYRVKMQGGLAQEYIVA